MAGRLAVVDEEWEDEPRFAQAEARTPAPAREAFQFPATEIVAMLTAIAAILGARAALFLAGIAGFWITLTVIANPSPMALIAQGLFLGLGVIPLVVLSALRKL